MSHRSILILLLCLVPLPLAGCGRPSRANIQLRKQNHELREELARLERRVEAHQATIRTFETEQAVPPAVASDRLEKLYTVHGIKFGRLTGGVDLDRRAPGDEMLKVYVVPVDGAGDELKAAGSFEIELFDLNAPGDARIGRWTFGTDEARKHWFGQALLYGYVFTLPLHNPPEHEDLLVNVRFVDELTGRAFEAKRDVTVKVPPTTQPQGGPAAAR